MREYALAASVAICALASASLAQAFTQAESKKESAQVIDRERSSLDAKRLALDQETLKQRAAADEARLAFDRQKAERDHQLERDRLQATALSLAAPAIVAALAYVFQVWARRRDEHLQFQLKVAEIVMDVRDSDVARRKAEFLGQLFPQRLESLRTGLRENKELTYFGPSMERREELLRILAQYPEGRADIIRAWEVLFPWSAEQEWFRSLRSDTTLNRNHPPTR